MQGKRQRAKGKRQKDGRAPFHFCLLPSFPFPSYRSPPFAQTPLRAFQRKEQEEEQRNIPQFVHVAFGDAALRINNVVAQRLGIVERVVASAGFRREMREQRAILLRVEVL